MPCHLLQPSPVLACAPSRRTLLTGPLRAVPPQLTVLSQSSAFLLPAVPCHLLQPSPVLACAPSLRHPPISSFGAVPPEMTALVSFFRPPPIEPRAPPPSYASLLPAVPCHQFSISRFLVALLCFPLPGAKRHVLALGGRFPVAAAYLLSPIPVPSPFLALVPSACSVSPLHLSCWPSAVFVSPHVPV